MVDAVVEILIEFRAWFPVDFLLKLKSFQMPKTSNFLRGTQNTYLHETNP